MSSKISKLIVTCVTAAAMAALPVCSAYAFDHFKDTFRTHSPLSIQVSAAQFEQAQSFIADLGEQAISIIQQTDLTTDQRNTHFRNLLQSNFDMRTIARFALGRYWRTASTTQQKEYLDLFNDMVIKVYSKRFEDYSGQQLEVTGARFEGTKDIIVNSVVVPPNGGAKIKVDWRVRDRGKGGKTAYKVIDVIVEGISMSLTQRSDFSSVIQRGGGDVSVLLVHLGQDS